MKTNEKLEFLVDIYSCINNIILQFKSVEESLIYQNLYLNPYTLPFLQRKKKQMIFHAVLVSYSTNSFVLFLIPFQFFFMLSFKFQIVHNH